MPCNVSDTIDVSGHANTGTTLRIRRFGNEIRKLNHQIIAVFGSFSCRDFPRVMRDEASGACSPSWARRLRTRAANDMRLPPRPTGGQSRY